MTEVFRECEDVVRLIRSRRPEWLRVPPDSASFHRLRADWAGGRGFWYRARHDTASEARRIAFLEGDRMDRARDEARQRRADMARLRFENMPLTGWRGRPIGHLLGWDGDEVDAWRLESVERWWLSFVEHPEAATVDWLSPFVDVRKLSRERRSWNRLWLYEATAEDLPREWMRWAVRMLQGVRKVTPGTPGDNQLAVYLYEVDGLVSADAALVDIVNRVRVDSPLPAGEAHLLRHGDDPLSSVAYAWSNPGE